MFYSFFFTECQYVSEKYKNTKVSANKILKVRYSTFQCRGLFLNSKKDGDWQTCLCLGKVLNSLKTDPKR